MPTMEELQAEIAALRAERDRPVEDEQPNKPVNGAEASGPITPQLVAVYIRDGGILATTVGAIQLNPSELKKISKVASRAFKRAMTEVVAAISDQPAAKRKEKPAKKTRKRRKSAGPRLSKTGKPLGRPKEAKTVTYEPDKERPSAVVITEP